MNYQSYRTDNKHGVAATSDELSLLLLIHVSGNQFTLFGHVISRSHVISLRSSWGEDDATSRFYLREWIRD